MNRLHVAGLALWFGSALLAGCGSDAIGERNQQMGGSPGAGGSGAGGSGAGGAAGDAGAADANMGAGGSGGIQGTGGAPGLGGGVGSIAPGGVPTKLPLVPELTNVVATPNDDSAHVVFDPYPGAKDYRIYELPADANLTVNPDGTTTVPGGTYRCAGLRYGPPVPVDNEMQAVSGAYKTFINTNVRGFARTMADATLGHVWVKPGPGRVPVYALGDPALNADNSSCYFMRFHATRVKRYTTSEQERAMLLAARWRDDGIAFYAPAAGAAGSKTVFTTFEDMMYGHRLYFVDGPEKNMRKTPTAAFDILAQPDAESLPLMRVHYNAVCGASHDELVPGQARFERAMRQGAIPFTGVMWSPLKEEKILVVEALDRGCPYQGVLATSSFPAQDPAHVVGGGVYEPFFTLDELRTKVWAGPGPGVTAPNPTGEVYINGQADGNMKPRAIARSFVKIAPRPHEPMDFFDGFKDGTQLAPFTMRSTGNFGSNVAGASKDYDLTWYEINKNTTTMTHQYAVNHLLGHLLATYHDNFADTNGKMRLTPLQKGTMSASTFFHVTMETDILSSNRRYPQILISDQSAPVQNNLTMGSTVVVQTFAAWPIEMQIQFCERRTWDVNNQCPRFDLYKTGGGIAPVPEISEKAGMDWRVRWDVYASSKRVFVFLDGQPYGCADLPGAGIPEGPVTATFGDVLYHSAADLDAQITWYPFHRNQMTLRAHHMLLVARRNFDNIGFKSGVAPPPWDFRRLPCQTQTRTN